MKSSRRIANQQYVVSGFSRTVTGPPKGGHYARTSCKQPDLSPCVPEHHRLLLDEALLPHVRDEAGHRLRGIGGIEKNRFGSRRQLDRLLGRVGRDAVAF